MIEVTSTLAATVIMGYALPATAPRPANTSLQPIVSEKIKLTDGTIGIKKNQNISNVTVTFWPDSIERIDFLATLDEDHNGEGASAPDKESIKFAKRFVIGLDYVSPDPLIGLNSNGNVVIEFHEAQEFTQLVFLKDNQIEFYYSKQGNIPIYFEGTSDSDDFLSIFHYSMGFEFSV